jgi:hypothetical protein
MQSRPDTDFSADAGLGKDARNGSPGREDASDMALSAAFAMQLANARAVPAPKSDDEGDVVVVAAAPPLVIFGLEPEGEANPVQRRADIAALAQSLIAQVETSERIRLGGNGPITMTVPLNATALGLAEARLEIAKAALTVIFPVRVGADATVVNAALGELAQALAQRYPNRTIRLRSEEDSHGATDSSEFNPFKEPVGRRK